MDNCVDIYCLKTREFFAWSPKKTKKFFSSSHTVCYVKMFHCTYWLQFGQACVKLFAELGKRMEKNWNIQTIIMLFLKTFIWIIAKLPYNNARKKRFFSGKFAILRKWFLKSVTFARLPWSEFSKSLLFNFVTVYKKAKFFAFENLKMCRNVFSLKKYACVFLTNHLQRNWRDRKRPVVAGNFWFACNHVSEVPEKSSTKSCVFHVKIANCAYIVTRCSFTFARELKTLKCSSQLLKSSFGEPADCFCPVVETVFAQSAI